MTLVNYRRRAIQWVLPIAVLLVLAIVGGVVLVSRATAVDTSPTVATIVPSTTPARMDGIHTVLTWSASPDRTSATLDSQTVRMIVRTSVGGTAPRVRLSNAYGDRAITFAGVFLGRVANGATIVAGSNRRVTFNGSVGVTIAPGASVLSDAVSGQIAAGQKLAVSIALRGHSGVITGHNVARQTSFISRGGDFAATESAAAFSAATLSWFWLDGITVDVAESVGTIVALGDSITDGSNSSIGADNRWPDFLARRLAGQHGVANQGIAGNKVLANGSGVSTLARLDRDVLAQPGVRTVVLLQGINDIRWDVATSPQDLITAYRQIASRAHAKGIRVVVGTLIPFHDGQFSAAREAVRRGVNDFLRSSTEFDAVIDFDRVVRDTADPSRMRVQFDSGDRLHPSDAGYRAMADAIDLRVL